MEKDHEVQKGLNDIADNTTNKKGNDSMNSPMEQPYGCKDATDKTKDSMNATDKTKDSMNSPTDKGYGWKDAATNKKGNDSMNSPMEQPYGCKDATDKTKDL